MQTQNEYRVLSGRQLNTLGYLEPLQFILNSRTPLSTIMGHLIKPVLLLSLFLLTYGKKTGDKSYKVIHFKVPKTILQQALKPTPVLKSGVTITVPINVQDDENSELDEVEDITEAAISDDPVSDSTTLIVEEEVPVPTTTVAPVTQAPTVQDEVLPPEESVQGQVIRFPCACRDRQCGCCTGTILERVRMKACGNISFVPEDFVFDVRMSVNNNTVVRRRVSASDPPPICFNPRRAPFVRICAEISNIRIRNRNAYACLDINADIGGFQVYSASFRCFRLGASGYQSGLKPKPVSPGPKPVNLFGSSSNNDEGGFFENAASTIFGGDDSGPFDGIGDAIGDFFGRTIEN